MTRQCVQLCNVPVVAASQEIIHQLQQQLSSGAKLASLVSTLGYLRRLHTQQVIGAKRMLAAPGPLSAATFTLAPEEERQLLLQLMDDFLTCRNNWHVAELDALPRHNIYQYVCPACERNVPPQHAAVLLAGNECTT
ncbi:MAG: hypothetical protein EOO81_01930 [Oxalobacteraceae bacterium]|nr:MAG: hypothetical protein EOO81_01930 [Oxalobacteraceae bacterium]